MQEATAKGLACGQEASTILRPLLANSKDISRKASLQHTSVEDTELGPKLVVHLSMEAKNNMCYRAQQCLPISLREILCETQLSQCLVCEDNVSFLRDVNPLSNSKFYFHPFPSGMQMTSKDAKLFLKIWISHL